MPSMPLTTSPALVSLRTTSLSHLATYHLTSHLKQQHHHHFRRLLHFPPTYPTASPKSHTLSCRISPTSLLVGRNLVRALIHTTASASSFSPTARRASPPMSSSSPHPPPPQEVKIKAITLRPGGGAAVELVPLPTLRDDCILVRPTALGLNPTDWKSAEPPMFGPDPAGCRVGCDYAGVVEEVGPAVTKGFKIGSRVAGFAHGSNQVRQEDGAFAERIVVKGDLQIEIPENLSDVEAATLGVGITTVGQSLYQALGLPLPTAPSATPIPLLIYGGSTASGILGIQFARLSGCRVATTCSPRNFEYVKSLGAEAAFDYADPECAEKIRAFFSNSDGENPLAHVWDCIATPDTARVCVSAMSPEGGKYRNLLWVPDDVIHAVNPKVSNDFTFAYTVFGEVFEKWKRFEPSKEDLEFGKMFWELSRELLASGEVKVAPTDVNRGGEGLEGILVGLKELKEGKVSATKLVYKL